MAVVVGQNYILEIFELVPEEVSSCTQAIVEKVLSPDNDLVRLCECTSGIKVTSKNEVGVVKVGQVIGANGKKWKESVLNKDDSFVIKPGKHHLIINGAHLLIKNKQI